MSMSERALSFLNKKIVKARAAISQEKVSIREGCRDNDKESLLR